MPSHRQLIAVAVASLILAGCATPPENPAARATEEQEPLPPMRFEPCVEEAIAFDARTWREYHRNLRELIATDDPDREALATLGSSYRVAELERREQRLSWLVQQDPQRFVVDDGIEAFRDVDWTDADTAAMEAAGAATPVLDDRIEALFEQYNADPDLTLFTEYFQTRLRRTPGYERVVGELRDAERELERMLDRCLPYGQAESTSSPAPGEDGRERTDEIDTDADD